MTPRNQCGHCGRGGGEPRPWQDRFDLLCWSCNGWLVERERAERAEVELAFQRRWCLDNLRLIPPTRAQHADMMRALDEIEGDQQ